MFKGGMASMMQKAQKMQEDMQKAQAEIKNLTATGKAAGGAVQVIINGAHQATDLQIDEGVQKLQETFNAKVDINSIKEIGNV